MIEEKKIGSLTQLSATNGYLHKIGTDTYVKSLVLARGDSPAMYEEVDEIPPYTKVEYDSKVAEMVRQRYSESEEFAIQRKVINSMLSPMTLSAESAEVIMTEYATYNNYVEDCKVRAKEILSNPHPQQEEGSDETGA